MTTKKAIVTATLDRLEYLTQEDAEFAVDTIIESIKSHLIAGNRVEIRGLGSFSVRKRKYVGRDEYYNTVYYRMSKNIFKKLNPELKKTQEN